MQITSYASIVTLGVLLTSFPQISNGIELNTEWGWSDFTSEVSSLIDGAKKVTG